MASNIEQYNLAVVGCGKMAAAILTGLIEAISQDPTDNKIKRIFACVRSSQSATRLQMAFSQYSDLVQIIHGDGIVHAAAEADVVMLAYKPYMLHSALSTEGMRDALQGKIVVSILGGITEAQFFEAFLSETSAKKLDHNLHLVRVVPNMAASVRESMTVIAEPSLLAKSKPSFEKAVEFTTWMFGKVGKVIFLPDSLFGLATVLVGACIALTTIAVDGILDASVMEGMQRPTALEVASQCLIGTAKLLDQGTHPAVLRESISSPRGCTIRGIRELEMRNVRSAFTESVVKASEHVKEMGKHQD